MQLAHSSPSQHFAEDTHPDALKKGKHACAHCKKAHLSCDFSRPCRRCTNAGRECVDADHKPRGRPRMKEKDMNEQRSQLHHIASKKRPSSSMSTSSTSTSISEMYSSSYMNSSLSAFHGGMVGAHDNACRQHSPSAHGMRYDMMHQDSGRRMSSEDHVKQTSTTSISTLTSPSQQPLQLMNVYVTPSLHIAKYPPMFASMFNFPIMNEHICDLLMVTSDQEWLASCVNIVLANTQLKYYGRIHIECMHSVYLYDICVRACKMYEDRAGEACEVSYAILSFGKFTEVMHDDV